MDTSLVSSLVSMHVANTATRTGDAVAVSVLKKSLDIQAEMAAQLIQAATEATATSTQVGSNINIYA